MAYRLSRKAEEDLTALFITGAQQFGLAQAEHYFTKLEQTLAHLARFPRVARERAEINPPVRVHPHQSHLVIYLIEGADILILRIRHAHEDWEADG